MNCGSCNHLIDIDKSQDGGYCFVTGNFCKFHNECDCSGIPIIDSPLYKTEKELKNIEPKYCEFCFNSRIYEEPEDDWFSTPLTDENDSCSIGVGRAGKNRCIRISSGYGEPTRIEFDEWSEECQRWFTSARYYPKYCPECGRRLDEYERSDEQ